MSNTQSNSWVLVVHVATSDGKGINHHYPMSLPSPLTTEAVVAAYKPLIEEVGFALVEKTLYSPWKTQRCSTKHQV